MGNSITTELISATSALNTETTYSGPKVTVDNELVMLPDAEPLVLHSQEHIASAIEVAGSINKDLSAIQVLIYKLDTKLEVWEELDSLIRTIQHKL